MRKSIIILFMISWLTAGSQAPGPGMRAPSLFISQWVRQTSMKESVKIHEMDRPLVIDFFATWCLPCRNSIPHIENLADKFSGQVDFLVISSEKAYVLNAYFQGQEGSANVAADWLGKTQFAYGVRFIPATFFVDKHGVVRWSGRPEELQEEMLEWLIRGKSLAQVDSLGNLLGPVDTRELNRPLVETFHVNPVYQLEINESDPVEVEFSKSDHYLNMKATLYQVLGTITGVLSEARFEFPGNKESPFLQVRIAAPHMTEQQLKAELLDRLRQLYGFRLEKEEVEREVTLIRIHDSGRLPPDDLYDSEGTESQLIVIPDSLIYADNIHLDGLAAAFESRYGKIFINDTGDINPRDWKIPDPGLEGLESFLLEHYGLALVRACKPVMMTRVEFLGE